VRLSAVIFRGRRDLYVIVKKCSAVTTMDEEPHSLSSDHRRPKVSSMVAVELVTTHKYCKFGPRLKF
jgi:hypothetical protein